MVINKYGCKYVGIIMMCMPNNMYSIKKLIENISQLLLQLSPRYDTISPLPSTSVSYTQAERGARGATALPGILGVQTNGSKMWHWHPIPIFQCLSSVVPADEMKSIIYGAALTKKFQQHPIVILQCHGPLQSSRIEKWSGAEVPNILN